MSNPQGIPKPVDQFKDAQGGDWPGAFNAANCWATSISEIRAFATKTDPLPPPRIRTLSGNLKRRVGWLEDDRAALLALGLHEGTDDPYVPSFQMYYGIGFDRFDKKLENPLLAFTVPTDYDQVPDWLSEDKNFDEGHSVTVFGGTIKTEDVGHGLGMVKTVLVHDPIHGKAKRWPLSVLHAAGGKICHSEGHPPGQLYAVQVRQAIPKPPPPPPPPPPDDPCKDAKAALTEANRLLGEAQKALIEAEGERDDALEKLAAIDAIQHPRETP